MHISYITNLYEQLQETPKGMGDRTMNYLKYRSDILMLEEQTGDYYAKEGAVHGHLKIETGSNKGALRCQVQNLRYFAKGDYVYKLIFFGKKNERTIHAVIGNLMLNKNGNGETYFRFHPTDVDGNGSEYADFSTAIVAAVSSIDEKEPLHPVLKGETGNVALPRVEKEETLVMAAKTEQDDEEIEKEEPIEIKKEIPSKNYNRFYNEYLLHACSHMCRVSEFYEEVHPFSDDSTKAQWKKIRNVASLPMVSPGAQYFATQYRHYLFGAKGNHEGVAEQYYFAIPGKFNEGEKPDGGESGFSYWQPMDGAERKKNAYGYWIAAIEAVTGDIVPVEKK